MSKQKEFILQGSPLEEIPDCSLGEYIVAKMRLLPRDKVIEVDADRGEVQTVQELLAKGVRLSEGLRKLGLKENEVVGLMCRNCFEASEVVLGTWLSGAAIAPVHGKMTVGEFKHVLGITKPKFIFCEEEAICNVKEALNLLSLTSKMILIGDTKHPGDMCFQEVLAEVDVENYNPQPVKSPANQLVAILSSSGTSGLPKGVGITHRNLIFQDLNMELSVVFDSKTNFLQISHFFWVTGVLTFLKSLTTGMTRVLLRDPTVPNILKAIEQYKSGLSLAAPAFVLSIATHPDFEKFDVSSLKTFLVGGSPYVPTIGEKIKKMWPGIKLKQLYGATEATGSICSNDEGDPYSLGKPTPGVQVKVIDTTTGESLPANALGEIAAKSPGVMACYVGNENAYKEAVDASGWFHTGDLGYYDDSGQFFLVDRLKEMVKIMNMQVAPVEVESAILSVPGVVEAFVCGVTRDGNFFELLALVVKEKNSSVTEEDIHAHIASTLSEYKKLTGGVHFVESLPKTASGKVHRSKVKVLAQSLYSGR